MNDVDLECKICLMVVWDVVIKERVLHLMHISVIAVFIYY